MLLRSISGVDFTKYHFVNPLHSSSELEIYLRDGPKGISWAGIGIRRIQKERSMAYLQTI